MNVPRAFIAAVLGLLCGCAWFQEPVQRAPDREPPAATAESVSPAGAPADSLAPSDSALAGEAPPPGRVPAEPVPADGRPPEVSGEAVPPEALAGEDHWELDGQALNAVTTPEGQVLRIEYPVIRHETLLLNARRGTYLVDRRLGRLQENVIFQDGDVTGRSDAATYSRDTEVLTATGNLEVQSDSLYLRGVRGTYDRNAGRIELYEGFEAWSGQRHLTGDRGTWNRNTDSVLVEGSVRLSDRGEDSWVTGTRLDHDLVRDLALVTGHPQLVVNPEAGGSTRILGRRIWLDRSGAARAGGDVEVYRGAVVGYADSAAFFRDDRLAVLYENPRVTERNGTMIGDTLFIHFDEDERLDRVTVHGNAFLRYAPTDSVKSGELSIVQGDSLTMYFADGEADHIVVFGNARSSYTPPPTDNPEETGSNVAQGDTITIFLEDAEVDRVTVVGNAKGVYTFGAGPATGSDSLAAPVFPDSLRGGRGRGTAPGDSLAAGPGDSSTAAPGDSLAAGPGDSSTAAPRDSLAGWMPWDSIGAGRDTTIGVARAGDSLAVRMPDAPRGRERVDYLADSVLFVLPDRTVDLIGGAKVDYGELTLTAGRIRFYADKRYLEAEEEPVLRDRSEGAGSELIGKRMDYNLKSRQGTIDEGWTKAEEGYVLADRLRQVGDGDYIARNGRSTTCDLIEDGKDPHFHFSSRKMRIYLGDKVVAKPVTLYIRDIPVLALPFYVFSIRKGRHSGFLTPDFDFGLGSTSGRYFKNLGYYWATNDYVDFTFSADYQERGSQFIGRVLSRYAKRYLMDGTVSFAQTIGSDRTLRDINAAHTMSVGEWNLTGRGEFRDEGFREREPLGNDLGQRLDRFLVSDISLSRRFEIGASLTASLSRREDLAEDPADGVDREILRETLPNYSFSLNSRPLGREPDAEGEGGRLPFLSTTRWSFRSSGSTTRTKNEDTRIDSTGVPGEVDTTFAIVTERNSSARHTFSLSDRRKLFGVLNLGPSLTATENWVDREFSPGDTTKGFHRALTYSTSFGGGTTAYGTFPGIGPVQAVRHTLEPNVSFSYQPEFENLTFETEDGLRRNRYPGVSASERQFLSLSVSNRFQAKVQGAEQIKRVDLFNWSLGTSYDFLADERGWGTVSSGVDLNRILGINMSFNSSHDPYRQFRVSSFQARSSFGFRGVLPGAEDAGVRGGVSSEVRDDALNRKGADIYQPSEPVGTRAGAEEPLTWNASFSLSYLGSRIEDRLDTNASLNSSVSLQVTKNWYVSYNNVWNITEGDVGGESFTLHRDLHCWEASFGGSRLGNETTFHIRINVKEMPDIKYEQGRSGDADLGGLTSFLP